MEATSTVKPVPEGYHTVTPYLLVNGASNLLTFMKEAFDAEEKLKFASSDGTAIRHAEVKIGDSIVMFADATAEYAAMPTMFHLYVKDTDTVYRRALRAGAVSLREPIDQPHGDRSAGVKDAWGNQWWIATHIEDVTPEEMQRRLDATRRKTENT
jgi:PhnB protein